MRSCSVAGITVRRGDTATHRSKVSVTSRITSRSPRSPNAASWTPFSSLTVTVFENPSLVRRGFSNRSIYQDEVKHLVGNERFAYLAERNTEFRDLWVGVLEAGVADGTFRSDIDVELVFRFMRDTVWVAVRWYRPGGSILTSKSAVARPELVETVTGSSSVRHMVATTASVRPYAVRTASKSSACMRSTRATGTGAAPVIDRHLHRPEPFRSIGDGDVRDAGCTNLFAQQLDVVAARCETDYFETIDPLGERG